jgi:hypothetical protein
MTVKYGFLTCLQTSANGRKLKSTPSEGKGHTFESCRVRQFGLGGSHSERLADLKALSCRITFLVRPHIVADARPRDEGGIAGLLNSGDMDEHVLAGVISTMNP